MNRVSAKDWALSRRIAAVATCCSQRACAEKLKVERRPTLGKRNVVRLARRAVSQSGSKSDRFPLPTSAGFFCAAYAFSLAPCLRKMK